MKLLLLDRDPDTESSLRAATGDGVLRVACTEADGLRRVGDGGWDLILLDADFSGAGLDFLSRLRRELAPSVPTVLLTRRPSMELALDAIRRGAHDVLYKPPPLARLREILHSVRQSALVFPLPRTDDSGDPFIGSSPEMTAAFGAIARAATSDATVLVFGESGTGKERVARVLHAASRRAAGPFIAINCAAIPENLLESELFGHEKGAFTSAHARRVGRFERASGGTLFLDEIGDMSIALQSKILRALQEREVERVGGTAAIPIDVRVVAATHHDLTRAVREHHFREDLFYRLAVVTLHLPPLRERGSDLDLLALHFAARASREHGRPIRALSEEALALLRAHPWPGNVRQLRNAVERAVVMASGEVLLPEHFAAEVAHPSAPDSLSDDQRCTLREMEFRFIRRVLRETGNSVSAAAERLGIHRNTLRRKLVEHEIESG